MVHLNSSGRKWVWVLNLKAFKQLKMDEEVVRLRARVAQLEEQLRGANSSKKARQKISGMSAEVVDSNPYRQASLVSCGVSVPPYRR